MNIITIRNSVNTINTTTTKVKRYSINLTSFNNSISMPPAAESCNAELLLEPLGYLDVPL